MRLQFIQDSKGKDTGVFIPIAEWEYIKKCYPNIEEIQKELPQWQETPCTKGLMILKTNRKARQRNEEKLLKLEQFFI